MVVVVHTFNRYFHRSATKDVVLFFYVPERVIRVLR